MHGSAALKMLRNRPAGLLITDMDMPRGGGAQTLDKARRMLPRMPVIAISAGIGHILTKPLDLRQMADAMARILGRQTVG